MPHNFIRFPKNISRLQHYTGTCSRRKAIFPLQASEQKSPDAAH